MHQPPKSDRTPRLRCVGGPLDGQVIFGTPAGPPYKPSRLVGGVYARKDYRGGAVWYWHADAPTPERAP